MHGFSHGVRLLSACKVHSICHSSVRSAVAQALDIDVLPSELFVTTQY